MGARARALSSFFVMLEVEKKVNSEVCLLYSLIELTELIIKKKKEEEEEVIKIQKRFLIIVCIMYMRAVCLFSPFFLYHFLFHVNLSIFLVISFLLSELLITNFHHSIGFEHIFFIPLFFVSKKNTIPQITFEITIGGFRFVFISMVLVIVA